MRNTIDINVSEVKPGQIVFGYGYRWTVRENRFDALGNGGSKNPMPRHVLICDAIEGETYPGGANGPYGNGMTMGYALGRAACIAA